jgi:HK97 gp10 family phage protein
MTDAIRLDTAELDRIAAGLNVNVEQVIRAFAFEVEAEAKALAPYETGALKGSIYTRVKGGGGSQPKMIGNAPHEEIPAPGGNVIAVVGSGIEYAAFQELGTSRMGAQPFLGPAAEDRAHDLNDGSMWRKLFEK